MTPDQWTIYVCKRCGDYASAPLTCYCESPPAPTRPVEVVPAARLAEVEAERDRLREALQENANESILRADVQYRMIDRAHAVLASVPTPEGPDKEETT